MSEAPFAPLAGMPEASVFRPLLDGAVPVAVAEAEPVTASDATPEPGDELQRASQGVGHS